MSQIKRTFDALPAEVQKMVKKAFADKGLDPSFTEVSPFVEANDSLFFSYKDMTIIVPLPSERDYAEVFKAAAKTVGHVLFVVVGAAADAGVFNRKINPLHGRINAIHGNNADLLLLVRLPFGRFKTAPD